MANERQQITKSPDAKVPKSASFLPFPASPGTLGDFELQREIGRGGMGTVYQAWQRSLQRTVALKVLSQHVSASPTVVQRFLREAQAAAKLHHSHIIPIFAQGEDNGIYFYAMELVVGRSLNSIIATMRERQLADTDSIDVAETLALPRGKSALPVPTNETQGDSSFQASDTDSSVAIIDSLDIASADERIAAIANHIANAADALEYAHQQGVIHRDIKPHNLILGNDGRLRIADFGLARLDEQPGVTVTGEVLGSPLYMSPEQILEGPSKVDGRADIYSLGVTMYEWLTFKPPFPGETREQVVSKILSQDAPSPRTVSPLIPIDLETICLKAIDRDRNRRYQRASELRDDLRRFIAKRPITARRLGLFERSRRMIQRHQVAALFGVVAVFAALLAWTQLSKRELVKEKSAELADAQRQLENSRRDAEEAGKKAAAAASLQGFMNQGLPPEIAAIASGAGLAAPLVEDLVRGGRTLAGLNSGESGNAVSAAIGTNQALAQEAAFELYETYGQKEWPLTGTPADAFPLSLRQAVSWRASDPARAFELVDALIAAQMDNVDALQLHAFLAARLDRSEKVIADGEALVRLAPQDARSFLWRGLGLLLDNKVRLSFADFDRAVALGGYPGFALALRGLALLVTEAAADAQVALNQALEANPQLVFAVLSRAHVISLANTPGSYLLAIDDVNKILESHPKNAEALIRRGDYSLALGHLDQATADYQRAMSITGQNPVILVRLFATSMKRFPQSDDTAKTNTEVPRPPSPPIETSNQSEPDADATAPASFDWTLPKPRDEFGFGLPRESRRRVAFAPGFPRRPF